MQLYNLDPNQINHGLHGSEILLQGTGLVVIKWDNGTETVHRNVPEEIDCRVCNGKVIRPDDLVRYEGLCGKCFPEVKFNVPYSLKASTMGFDNAVDYFWKRQVKETSTAGKEANFTKSGADFFGNNFGLQDIVFYDPKKQHVPQFRNKMEGVVLDIHKYSSSTYFHKPLFLTRVYFPNVGKVDLPAHNLEALTCSGLSLNQDQITKFQKMLKDVVVRYDPKTSGEQEAFEDPIARAILISYRQNHLIETGDPVKMNKVFCDISKRLRETSIPRERLHLWLKKQLRTTHFRMEDEQIAALVPFLTGEKTANYHLE